MFWKTEKYDTPTTDESVEELLTKYAAANKLNLLDGNAPNTFVLKSFSDTPSLTNLFSLKIFAESSTDKRRISIELVPKAWLLGAMVLMVMLGVITYKFDSPFRRIAGLSIPLLIVTPYFYAIISTSKLLGIKHHLMPGYADTKEGRLEVLHRSYSPLKLFLKIQQNAYITFVVVLIFVLLLWMTGVIESLNPAGWFKH